MADTEKNNKIETPASAYFLMGVGWIVIIATAFFILKELNNHHTDWLLLFGGIASGTLCIAIGKIVTLLTIIANNTRTHSHTHSHTNTDSNTDSNTENTTVDNATDN